MSSQMNVGYFSNEFPKDDLVALFRELHDASKSSSHPALARFLSESTSAVQQEVRQLPVHLRDLIPPFTTIFSWAENGELREGALCGAVDGVLLIIVQVAIYIGHLEADAASPNHVAGLGVGLLSAAVAAISEDLARLPLIGADAVRIAFRMGVHVQAVSENLEPRDETPDTWAYVITPCEPATIQTDLDAAQTGLAATSKVFISAVSRTSVTVSGPPARLRALLNKSDFCRGATIIPLPVYGGLCHAAHVYGQHDVQSIVKDHLPATDQPRPRASLYSTSSGRAYPAENGPKLFENVVTELLTQPITWDNVVSTLALHASQQQPSDIRVHSFSNSIPLKDLTSALSEHDANSKINNASFLSWMTNQSTRAIPRGTAQSKLAIVGMACRLPGGAKDTEKFWELLEAGLDVSRQIPADRFDVETHFDPTGKDLNKSMTEYGCFIDEPGLFDAPFFNMSPREAQVVDPQMRLALVTAYEALERSGYVECRTAATQLSRIGTWYGQAADDYREVNQGQEVSTYYIPGGCRAFGPGRINYFFKFSGPSYSVDTACSSGLAAIEVACQSLWNGEVDTAIAGGLNVLTNPDGFAGLCNGYFLTKGHNACKTWDATADGYCRADAVGSVVIKRLEDAEMDNDNILGVILGAGTNHSATAVSITHPHAGHQAYLARQVLRQAGVDPLDVSYVELHGTGTQAGDFEEMQGITDVYAPLAHGRSKNQPLHIGAVKSNVGHSESAAGTTALLKVLLMLQKEAIPRHIGIKTEMNPRIPRDLEQRNLHIPFETTPWPRQQGQKRLAAVNNFGAAGGNTTMLLEEAPLREIVAKDQRPAHVVTLSAKTKTSLRGNIERLLDYLGAHPDIDLGDLSYTTTARRYQHSFRVAVVTGNVEHLKKQLASRLETLDTVQPVDKTNPPQIGFAFTGQGASYKSMSLQLYQDAPVFRESINHLDSLARAQGFPSFVCALDGSHDKNHLHAPVITQLALVCIEIALVKYWASLGVRPDVVVGHSLGEYAAFATAGVITANEVIFMVGRRAQMLEERCQQGSHSMLAVRTSLKAIQDAVAEDAEYTVACVNGPSDTVLSGTNSQINELSSTLESAGHKTIKLDVAFAFHSEQTDPILDDFEALSKSGVIFQEPKVPVISPLLERVVFDGKTLNANYMRLATRGTVNFLGAVEAAQEDGAIGDETLWLDIGPHPVCCGFLKSSLPSVACAVPSMRRGEDNWKTMAESMAALHLEGIGLDWNGYHKPFESRLRLLDLPTYAFNDKNYWLAYKGDWCLTKGNDFYTKGSAAAVNTVSQAPSEITTSTVQRIVESSFEDAAGTVVVESDLQQPEFLAAAHGHCMNGCGVVTSSIHADICFTLGGYLIRKLGAKKDVRINISDLVVTKGLVAQTSSATPQLIRITASTPDIRREYIDVVWQNVDNHGTGLEPFATARLELTDSLTWLKSWASLNHLVSSRVEALERMAAEGVASRFSGNMAYTLFASNLVDYAEKYRGMQSVVMHGLEAFADIKLTTKDGGSWTVPPYFIDSVAHLAGFVMNCSDAMDTRNNFCVTPGWSSMKFAKPLTPGARYRSYVKMIPTAEDPQIYLGDVYIMQGGEIVGCVGAIKFRRYPRLLLSRFFSPPDMATANESQAQRAVPRAHAPPKPSSGPTVQVETEATPPLSRHDSHEHLLPVNLAKASPDKKATQASNAPTTPTRAVAEAATGIVAQALELIAAEAALEISDLKDEVSFADLGVDSLMSLVIAEKLRGLGLKGMGSSFFLDYPKIGDFTGWLREYHG